MGWKDLKQAWNCQADEFRCVSGRLLITDTNVRNGASHRELHQGTEGKLPCASIHSIVNTPAGTGHAADAGSLKHHDLLSSLPSQRLSRSLFHLASQISPVLPLSRISSLRLRSSQLFTPGMSRKGELQ